LSRTHLLKTLLKVLVTLSLLAWVASRIGLQQITGQLAGVRPGYLIAAVLIFTVSNFLGAWQWQRLMNALEIPFSYGRALNLYFVGLFFNNFLIGSLGGDIVKVFSVSRQERRGREALAATFVDRFAGFFVMAGCAILACLFLILHPLLRGHEINSHILHYVILIFLVFLLGTVLLFSRRVSYLIYEILLARFNPLGLRDKLRQVHDFFHAYRHKYGLGLQVFGLSTLIQVLRIAVHYYCALSIGFDIDFIYFLVFVPLIAMAALLPISVGGFGVRESTAPFLFGSVAVVAAADPSGTLAFTTQFLASLVGYLVGAAGGVMFLFSGRKIRVEEAEDKELEEVVEAREGS